MTACARNALQFHFLSIVRLLHQPRLPSGYTSVVVVGGEALLDHRFKLKGRLGGDALIDSLLVTPTSHPVNNSESNQTS